MVVYENNHFLLLEDGYVVLKQLSYQYKDLNDFSPLLLDVYHDYLDMADYILHDGKVNDGKNCVEK